MAESMDARRVVSINDVVLGGCRYFLRHGTIDMRALATALAVSRATLYRVAGSRDHLLGEVLWLLGMRNLARARRERIAGGIEGIIEVTHRFSLRVLGSKPLRTFIATEPDTAVRVLFTPAGRVHQRFVAVQKEIFIEAANPAEEWLAADLDYLAYLYVRIVESMLYAELLNGRPPDLDLGERAARALLRSS